MNKFISNHNRHYEQREKLFKLILHREPSPPPPEITQKSVQQNCGSRSKGANSKLTVERVREVMSDLQKQGISVTQRNIIKRVGGSYTTLVRVMQRIEQLETATYDLNITISDATISAIKLDIQRHIEMAMASVRDRAATAESARMELREATETISALQDTLLNLAMSTSIRALVEPTDVDQ